MGRFVIAAFTPKPDKADELLAVVRKHWQILRTAELVTDRPAYIMRARDGTILEVFEWLDSDAIQRAQHADGARTMGRV